MVLVDSSVWIDFFRQSGSRNAEVLRALVRQDEAVVGDLMLTEVLRGFDGDRAFLDARAGFAAMETIQISDETTALLAADHYRWLRRRGVTVRSTIDTLIAARCIVDGLALLHSDRDFAPFAEHLGLKVYAPSTRLH